MKNLRVCEGLEIININGHTVETLKKSNNSIETGSQLIIDGLDIFIDCLSDEIEDGVISYEQAFIALKQLISIAEEKSEIRTAIMTGAVDVSKVKTIKRTSREVSQDKKIPENIAKYALKHTIDEIQYRFGFQSRIAVKDYIQYHNIEYVKVKAGRKPKVNLNPDKVRELAKQMRLCELCRTFMVNKDIMLYFCRKNKIEYIKKRGR